ncbi:hypothetical protein P168DRAFT_137162 [Aspergillus campestris IBT 28561]|uniref:Uncharacterized protein n=1 Tax=Aspergillus campestris (strain IBT 28561) TaxID=1392248 RepID=A0A2I1D478_ASPC2|nr:uncharacterized protein P168DRAFT_137162 [Aspergillus campestris IBT 28561]PKY04658.1 hypothetical protein P168DRAFT_137162 [Aspergillus campestris IBT 28561]
MSYCVPVQWELVVSVLSVICQASQGHLRFNTHWPMPLAFVVYTCPCVASQVSNRLKMTTLASGGGLIRMRVVTIVITTACQLFKLINASHTSRSQDNNMCQGMATYYISEECANPVREGDTVILVNYCKIISLRWNKGIGREPRQD